MGLTPLEGLVMGTRSGDVDPGLFGYLAEAAGLTAGQVTDALNTASGLAGLSGVGNDMRTVVAAAAGGDERAGLALEVFVHRLAKAVAGMVVGLGRLDALVFTGGIGSTAPRCAAGYWPGSGSWAWPRTPRPTPSTAARRAGASAWTARQRPWSCRPTRN